MDTHHPPYRYRNGQRLVKPSMWRIVTLPILVLALAMPLLAQSPSLAKTELDNDTIIAGGRFELKIAIPDTGISVPQAILPILPARISLISGPELTQDSGLDDAGRRTRFVYMHYVFRANTIGYVEFPPIDIQYGTQNFRTETILIGISPGGADSKVPPDLVWNVRSERVFEGQAVYLTLDLRFAETITFPEKVEVSLPQGGLFEEVRGLGQIESEIVAGKEFPRIPVATYIFTPSTRGLISLPSARISYANRVLNSQAQKLTVESLPSAVVSSGAIGAVHFSAFLSKSSPALDEQFLLTLRVEGEGNLNFLHIPEPQLGDLVMIGKADNSKFSASEAGFRGFRETVYRLSSSRLGTGTISLPGFNWIDTQGLIQSQLPFSLNYLISGQGGKQDALTQEELNRPLSLDDIKLLQPLYLYHSSLAWLFYIPGLLLLGTALVRGKRWRQLAVVLALLLSGGLVAGQLILHSGFRLSGHAWEQAVASGNAAYTAGDFQKANQQYVLALNQVPDSPGIMFNLAISCFGKNANAEGMYYLQKAVRILPDNSRFHDTIQRFEKQLDLDRQLPLLTLPSGDSLFLATAVFLTLAGLFLVLSRRYRSVGLISFSVLMLAGLLSAGAWTLGIFQINADVGIVSETGGVIRKIPDRNAAEWLTLKGGTSVLTLATTGNFFLVETAYGVKGWLDRSVLYRSHSPRGDSSVGWP